MSGAREAYEAVQGGQRELQCWRSRNPNAAPRMEWVLKSEPFWGEACKTLLHAALSRVLVRHKATILAETYAEAEAIVAERRAAAVKEAQDYLAHLLIPKKERGQD